MYSNFFFELLNSVLSKHIQMFTPVLLVFLHMHNHPFRACAPNRKKGNYFMFERGKRKKKKRRKEEKKRRKGGKERRKGGKGKGKMERENMEIV